MGGIYEKGRKSGLRNGNLQVLGITVSGRKEGKEDLSHGMSTSDETTRPSQKRGTFGSNSTESGRLSGGRAPMIVVQKS